jgi:predicted TIM-barrel fold metal-dependent hydrolase
MGEMECDVDVIDADGHVLEPADVWNEYLPREYRAFAPGWAVDTQGRNRRMIGGRMQPAWPTVDYDTKPVAGASDPHARLRDMDDVGIAIGYLYPSAGLHFGAIDRLDIVEVLSRAYNEWIRDFCAADRRRLRASAVVPQLDVAAAMREAEYAIGALGLSAVMLRPNPIGGRTLDDPTFDPLWSLIEELDVPVVLHEGTTMNVPQAGLDRYDNYMFLHVITHPHEHQMACLSLICGQVLQRHPKLRVAFVESGCGWVSYWLERMEQHVDYWGHASAPLAERPTDYWRRQCFVSPFPDERMLPQVIDVIGADTLIYTTDYPYPYPGRDRVVSAMRDRTDVVDADKRKILHDNATRLYGG